MDILHYRRTLLNIIWKTQLSICQIEMLSSDEFYLWFSLDFSSVYWANEVITILLKSDSSSHDGYTIWTKQLLYLLLRVSPRWEVFSSKGWAVFLSKSRRPSEGDDILVDYKIIRLEFSETADSKRPNRLDEWIYFWFKHSKLSGVVVVDRLFLVIGDESKQGTL